MRIIDTSAWIEWITGSDLGRSLSQHFPEQQDWLVPTIIQLELAKWLIRENRSTDLSYVMTLTYLCNIAPLDTEIAISAAEASRDHRLATADSIIYATARVHDADLLTCDHDFNNLPGVIFVPKT